MEKSIETANEALTRFLSEAKEPTVLEPGGDPIPLVQDGYSIDLTAGRLYLQAWTRDRTLTRRITKLLDTKAGVVEFAVERFGKRTGILQLYDASRPKTANLTRKASRQTYREQFRRSLLRQFPGWRIAELSSEADLEHSLSPAYPRALLQKGSMAQAAIGCPPDAQDVDGVLTFGLIWLDYLRTRESKRMVLGLSVFVPEGRQRTTCLRLLYLDPRDREWSVFVYTDRIEDKVDLQDYGNIETTLPTLRAQSGIELTSWMERLSTYPHVSAREERGGRISWTVRGLEFSRWEPGIGLYFGIETKRRASESNVPEIEGLARELARLRSPDSADRANPLYLKKPELWLEAQVSACLREVDASLESTPDISSGSGVCRRGAEYSRSARGRLRGPPGCCGGQGDGGSSPPAPGSRLLDPGLLARPPQRLQPRGLFPRQATPNDSPKANPRRACAALSSNNGHSHELL